MNQDRINFDWNIEFEGGQIPKSNHRPKKHIFRSYFDGEDVQDLLNKYVYRGNSLYLVDVTDDLGLDSSSFIVVRYEFVKRDFGSRIGSEGLLSNRKPPARFSYEKHIMHGNYPLLINYLTHLEDLRKLQLQVEVQKL